MKKIKRQDPIQDKECFTQNTPAFVKQDKNLLYAKGVGVSHISAQRTLVLASKGIQREFITAWFPACNVRYTQDLIKYREMRLIAQDRSYFEFPKNRAGYTKYRCVCESCGASLCYFWANEPSLAKDSDWFDLHHTSWIEDNRWFGTRGMNQDPYDFSINFECCCLAKTIQSRYTRYKIIRYEELDS